MANRTTFLEHARPTFTEAFGTDPYLDITFFFSLYFRYNSEASIPSDRVSRSIFSKVGLVFFRLCLELPAA